MYVFVFLESAHHLDGHLQSVGLAACSVDAGKPALTQEVQNIVILCTQSTVWGDTVWWYIGYTTEWWYSLCHYEGFIRTNTQIYHHRVGASFVHGLFFHSYLISVVATGSGWYDTHTPLTSLPTDALCAT